MSAVDGSSLRAGRSLCRLWSSTQVYQVNVCVTGQSGKGQLGKAGQLGVASLSTTTSVRDMAGCWPAKSHPWFWIALLF